MGQELQHLKGGPGLVLPDVLYAGIILPRHDNGNEHAQPSRPNSKVEEKREEEKGKIRTPEWHDARLKPGIWHEPASGREW